MGLVECGEGRKWNFILFVSVPSVCRVLLDLRYVLNQYLLNEWASNKNTTYHSTTPKSLLPRTSPPPLISLIQYSSLNLTPIFLSCSLSDLSSRSYSQPSLDSLPQTFFHLLCFFLSSLPFLDSLESIIPNALLSASSLTPNFITDLWFLKSLTHLNSPVCFYAFKRASGIQWRKESPW